LIKSTGSGRLGVIFGVLGVVYRSWKVNSLPGGDPVGRDQTPAAIENKYQATYWVVTRSRLPRNQTISG